MEIVSMITKHSIAINDSLGECFAAVLHGASCKVLKRPVPECGTAGCPFYKPKGCCDWVRVQDGKQATLVPPEEYYEERWKKKTSTDSAPVWRITMKTTPARSAV